MSREIVDRLPAEIRTAFADQELQQRAIGMSARLTGSMMVRIFGAQPE